MVTEKTAIIILIEEMIRRRKQRPSQFAIAMGVSHTTVSRWLRGKDTPSPKSCRKLADYSGIPLQRILSLSGHLPSIAETPVDSWPEFREYATRKYPAEMDEDFIIMIENLIAQRRRRQYNAGDS